jgi:hypothetical protein
MRDWIFESNRGFSRVADFHASDGVTSGTTRKSEDIGYGYLEVTFYAIRMTDVDEFGKLHSTEFVRSTWLTSILKHEEKYSSET